MCLRTGNDARVLVLVHVVLLAGVPQGLGAVLLDGVVELNLPQHNTICIHIGVITYVTTITHLQVYRFS